MPKVLEAPNPMKKAQKAPATPDQAKGPAQPGSDQNESSDGSASPLAAGKKGKKQPKPAKVVKEILYPRVEFNVYIRDPERCPTGYDPAVLTADIAKQYLGWQTEKEYAESLKAQYTSAELKNIDQTFGSDFLLVDLHGNKVRCLANLDNRPFDPNQADAIKLEVLRRKWEFNGESMIIDWHGMDQDCQHRLIGLVLADQEWHLDKLKAKPEQDWQDYWDEPPYMECIVVLGIDPDDRVINTINTGKGRTLADCIYRQAWFKSKPGPERERLAKITSWATKLLWQRTEAKSTSLAPRRPHSESFEFINNHERLLKCVKFISEEGSEKKLSPYLPLGYAAALMYLMATSRSDDDLYQDTLNEKKLDFTLMDKAEEFFVLICGKAKAMEPLAEALEKVPEDSGPYGMAMRLGLVVNAWLLWSDGKKLTPEKLELKQDNNDLGQPVIVSHPRCGGIDIDREDPTEQEAPAPKTKADKQIEESLAKGKDGKPLVDGIAEECIGGGTHEWVSDKDGEYCSKCKADKPKAKKGGK